MFNWLKNFILSAGGHPTSDNMQRPEMDQAEKTIGIHLYSNFGSDYSVISNEISDDIIKQAIAKLDWQNGFHQVICTIEPGVLMEVGGSLNPTDGLSAMYRNYDDGVESVIAEPPETIDQMIDIIVLFSKGDDAWSKQYVFS